MKETIRRLTPGDIPAALELSTLAGWNQTVADWQLLLDLAPDGCFAMQVGGPVVATATLVSYGERLGWVGMVLTHPEYRHRGFARRLFATVLDHADHCGIKTLKLDATEQGQPLYESYGFKVEQAVERWFRAGCEKQQARAAPAELGNWQSLDALAFGADRSGSLEMLRRRGQLFVNPDAYLLTRSGRVATSLGPCVSRTRDAARNIVEQATAGPPTAGLNKDGWFWDLLPSNENAITLASEMGFSRQRRLNRMFRGGELRAHDDLVYAIAGFELG